MAKRMLDLAVALALSPIAALLLAVAAVAIRLESAGPAVFKQVRVGREGKLFTCYKLRTMYVDTRQAASHEVARSSVTRVGAFLRKTKLDELPQLLNVIRGDMSLVGPRPCLPVQTVLIERRKALGVLRARPGITGLAQVNDIDMSDPERLAEIDAEYLRSATLLGDLRLMVLTLAGSGAGDRIKV
jgi:O-antigen biosynthesis protein WbqP